MIQFVENDLVFSVFLHSGFQVIALDDPSNAAEVFVSIRIGCGPSLLVHGEKGFYIALAAVRQRCHEYIGRDNFAGICVNNSGSIADPVHLYNLTGLVVQVHGSVGFCQIICVILVEMG